MLFSKKIHFPTIPSTNTYLKENYRFLPNYTVVSAAKQTAGRGRYQRVWIDGEDLLLSLLIKDDLDVAELAKISLVTAAAVHSALSDVADLAVKWPNDITARNRKISGILIESIICNKRLECLIIGIGINVNTANFPEDLQAKATSLYLENGRKYALPELKEQVLKQFAFFYEDFLQGGDLAYRICRQYSSLIGREVEIDDFQSRQKGVVLDILPNGNILFRLKEGTREFHSGEVTLSSNY
jgi:BirA family biotin operon repressor/biotin-[acetyl-CoA-carboxylase] ligase